MGLIVNEEPCNGVIVSYKRRCGLNTVGPLKVRSMLNAIWREA